MQRDSQFSKYPNETPAPQRRNGGLVIKDYQRLLDPGRVKSQGEPEIDVPEFRIH